MALAKGHAATPKREKRPAVKIDVSGEICRFREPGTMDLEAPGNVRDMLTTNFADIPAPRRAEIAIIGACYLPDKDEQGINATKLVAEIARDNEYVYVELRDQFFTAFPEFVDWLAAKAQAKNGLRQETETPSTTASAT